jgi:hypothetical protein
MKNSKIIKCTCEHDAQDGFHGKQMRVHSKIKQRETGNKMWRCTVCLKEKESEIV